MLGSTVAFLLGRYVARRLIERKLATMPRFAAIDRAVSAQGLRIVFLLRLSPIVPFNFLNYALGATRISIKDFVIASGHQHSVREFIDAAAAVLDMKLTWSGSGLSEVAKDRLDVNTLAGMDTVASVGLAAGSIQFFLDGLPVS